MNGRFYSYLNTAENLLQNYGGELPFHHYLKAYFREHSKYGSKDRKKIAALCYAYFRTGRSLMNIEIKEKILASLLLCAEESDEVLAAVHPEYNEIVFRPVNEKIEFLNNRGIKVQVSEIFPLQNQVSSLIFDLDSFSLSHLVQPRLFLRVRPGKEEKVEQVLHSNKIPFNRVNLSIELPNGTDVNNLLNIDSDAVVQDLSSQQTGAYISKALKLVGENASVWDCCAASGGKSLLAFDSDPSIDLTVSDLRPSIIHNLQQRFQRAGIAKYRAFTADLTKDVLPQEKFDIVIADVPCSGSGTWGRTPEELCFFTSHSLSRYVETQRAIIARIIPKIKPGGALLYFTCSVYREENEAMVNYVEKISDLKLGEMELITGYQSRADSMFMAMFTSPA